jgi:hypothetical protein
VKERIEDEVGTLVFGFSPRRDIVPEFKEL